MPGIRESFLSKLESEVRVHGKQATQGCRFQPEEMEGAKVLWQDCAHLIGGSARLLSFYLQDFWHQMYGGFFPCQFSHSPDSNWVSTIYFLH